MHPGFVGADTVGLAHGAVDLTTVGRDLAATGGHLGDLGRACAGSCDAPLSGPLSGFASAAAGYAAQVGEQVAAVGWLGSHLATDLDLATGGFS